MSEMTSADFASCGIDLSATKTASFHRPVSDAEVRQYLLVPDAPPPKSGDMDIGEGWPEGPKFAPAHERAGSA